jgi:adenylate cyclase
VHPTSVSGEEYMYGVEVQANAISTLLRDFPLREVPGWTTIALIVLFGAVGPLLAVRFGPFRAAFTALGLVVLYAVVVQLVFNGGRIVSFTYPELSLALGAVGALAVGLVVNAFEKERVRDLFSRFVPEPVVDEVLQDVNDDLRLGGERRVVTVLFADIRGFTSFSETKPPETVITVLNRYLTTMTDVILSHGGTLVCFMGDGIMATFGAPIEQHDHADRGLAAAREMTGPALARFNDWMRDEGHGDGFRIGVGLNSGAVMAGNVGSERRLEYTVIGDTTNTASRLEGLTKGTSHMVFMSESTRSMLTVQQADLINAGDFDVRGKQVQVTLWSLDQANGGGA